MTRDEKLRALRGRDIDRIVDRGNAIKAELQHLGDVPISDVLRRARQVSLQEELDRLQQRAGEMLDYLQ